MLRLMQRGGWDPGLPACKVSALPTKLRPQPHLTPFCAESSRSWRLAQGEQQAGLTGCVSVCLSVCIPQMSHTTAALLLLPSSEETNCLLKRLQVILDFPLLR